MPSIMDLVQQHLGPQEIAQIAQQLGTDPAATQQAIDAALPAMVGGMASTAQQPEGASQINSLMGEHGGVLANVGSMISAGGAGGGLLGSILGHHQPTVEQGVQQASGMSSDKTKKLLMILAPLVLSALARRTMSTDNSGAAPQPSGGGGLGGMLNGGLGGVLGSVLGGAGGGGLGDVLRQDATEAHQQAQGGPVGGMLGKVLGGLGG